MPLLRHQVSTKKKSILDWDGMDAKRLQFIRCSGMHTPRVQKILDEVCVYDKGRFLWNLNPCSCIEFVIPAFTKGIPEHLETICVMHGEIAVYAALFMTLYVGVYGGGFAPTASGVTQNYRVMHFGGWVVGCCCGLVNIMTSIFYRLAIAGLARESDMLVFISKTRYYTLLNPLIFMCGAMIGIIFCFTAQLNVNLRGDHCLDGSLAYDEWFKEWLNDAFPLGQGVEFAKGEPIKNPWAVKADELNITRPSSFPWGVLNLKKHSVEMDGETAVFAMYLEFMQAHFESNGNGCWGNIQPYNSMVWIMAFAGPLVYFCVVRNAHFYWLNLSPWHPGDPYDMSYAYQNFKQRIEIATELAARDLDKNGYVDAATEIMMKVEDKCVNLGVTDDTGSPHTQITFISPEVEQNRILSHQPSSGIGYYESDIGYGVSSSTTLDLDNYNAESHSLKLVGIDNSFHRILISSGLVLDTLLMAADDRLYLNSLLKEAGVMMPGDRVKIFNALREDFGVQIGKI